jgi:hypothetical protein
MNKTDRFHSWTLSGKKAHVPDHLSCFAIHSVAQRPAAAQRWRNIGAVLLTNKYHALEDAQVSQIMKGIRSILQNGDPPEPSRQRHAVQWALVAVLVIGLGTVPVAGIRLARIAKQSDIGKTQWFLFGVCLLLIGLALPPAISLAMGTPLHSVTLFAPDVALLFTLFQLVLILHSTLFFNVVRRKGIRNLSSLIREVLRHRH